MNQAEKEKCLNVCCFSVSSCTLLSHPFIIITSIRSDLGSKLNVCLTHSLAVLATLCFPHSNHQLRKKSCVKGVPFFRTAVMCPRGAVLPEPGWIFYTFFKVHRHFCVFLVYSHFSLPMSSPAAGCRLNCADGDWYPLTRSSLSPLSR